MDDDLDLEIIDKKNIISHKNSTFIDLRKYLVIDIENEPWDLCSIKNEKLLAANYFQENLTLFDKDYKVIKTIDKIGNLKFKSLSIATNNEDKIYVSDFAHDRIIACNFEFELVSTVGKKGSNNGQFNGASGVCYYENALYVCDYNNRRIQKLNSNTLEFESSYQVTINPYYIQIIDSIAAIRPDDESYVFFYKLSDFTILEKYYDRNGYICISNSCFYQFDYSIMKIFCYDNTGKAKNEIKIEGLDDANFDDWTCLTQFGEKLVICPGSSFKMVIV